MREHAELMLWVLLGFVLLCVGGALFSRACNALRKSPASVTAMVASLLSTSKTKGVEYRTLSGLKAPVPPSSSRLAPTVEPRLRVG